MRPYADVALRAASRPSSCGSHDGNPHNSHSLICGILILDCRRPPVPASAFIHGALLRGRLAAVGDGTFPMCTLGCGAALNRPTVCVPVDRGRRPRRSGSRISYAELGRRLAAVKAVAAKRCEPTKRNRQVCTTLRAYLTLTTSATRGAARGVRPFGQCSGPC
jgi:hypothetical protein